MKPIFLFLKSAFFVCLVFLASACKKEQCLDLVLLDSMRAELQSWYVADTIHRNFIITDRNGIHQTLYADKPYRHILEKHVEDDCGNYFGNYNFSIQYNTSVSPIHLMVDIRGAALDYGGFNIEVSYTRTWETTITKKARYDLYKKESIDDQASFKILLDFAQNGFIYDEVLEITFLNTSYPAAIEKVWFAKRSGIIRFDDHQGNSFMRTNVE